MTRATPVYKPPMVYFGTKHKICQRVWEILNHDGRATHSVEPFGGTGVWTLNRPDTIKRALLNDVDGHVVNVMRSVARNHDAMVEELSLMRGCHRAQADLLACDNQVRQNRGQLTAKITANPEYCDPKLAAWYLYGNNAYLGGGFGQVEGTWIEVDGELVDRRVAGSKDQGLCRQVPGTTDQGLCRKVPGTTDRGLCGKVPDSNTRGLKSKGSNDKDHLQDWAGRLKGVEIYCSNWKSMVSDAALRLNKAHVPVFFFDPPYATEVCNAQASQKSLYWTPEPYDPSKLLEWCRSNQVRRIVLCGYKDEHDGLLADGWSKESWDANSAYNNGSSKGKESLWISPGCNGYTKIGGDV